MFRRIRIFQVTDPDEKAKLLELLKIRKAEIVIDRSSQSTIVAKMSDRNFCRALDTLEADLLAGITKVRYVYSSYPAPVVDTSGKERR